MAKTVNLPEVTQRMYCATCHTYIATHVYPACSVVIADGDESCTPQSLVMVHVSACPDHSRP